jgi:hypothetical protein
MDISSEKDFRDQLPAALRLSTPRDHPGNGVKAGIDRHVNGFIAIEIRD